MPKRACESDDQANGGQLKTLFHDVQLPTGAIGAERQANADLATRGHHI